jgi:hypothetical protein
MVRNRQTVGIIISNGTSDDVRSGHRRSTAVGPAGTVAARCRSDNRVHLEYRRQLRRRTVRDICRHHSLDADSIAVPLALAGGGNRLDSTSRHERRRPNHGHMAGDVLGHDTGSLELEVHPRSAEERAIPLGVRALDWRWFRAFVRPPGMRTLRWITAGNRSNRLCPCAGQWRLNGAFTQHSPDSPILRRRSTGT